MRRILLLACFATTLLLAPAAEAAVTPVVLGDGSEPGLAVDGAGTAYVAWNGTEPTGVVTLHFCRLPRGATACTGAATIPAPFLTLSRPFISVSGATVRVVQTRYGFDAGDFNQAYVFTSADGGNSFDAGHQIGTLDVYEGTFGPGDAFSGATNADSNGGLVQRMPLSAGAAATSAILFPSGLTGGNVAITPQGQQVAVFEAGTGDAQIRVQSGAGDANDAASWGPPVAIGYASYPRFASGPKGLFMLAGTSNRGIEVRRWNGTTFAPGTTIAPDTTGTEIAQAHLSQDAGGHLQAVWPRFDADGIHLLYATSDDGVTWASGTLLIQTDDEESSLRVAAAADHTGVAVWQSRVNAVPQIRVAPIGPDAPPEFHKTVVIGPVSGKVRIKRKGTSKFVALDATDDFPLGSTVDADRGRLELSSAPSKTAAPQTLQLYNGQFTVTQTGAITQFTLSEALASCGRNGKAAAAAKKPKSRKLWGDGSGSFRTRGRFSSATVRGTRWLVQDTCAGTLTQVKKGVVLVRDNVRHKNVVVRAGKQYLARAKR